MGGLFVTPGGGGGVGSDELTASLADVIKGKTAVTSDSNDEIGTGTLELTGDAGTGDVVSGKGFYTTDPKTKSTGTLADKNGTTQSATPSLDTTNSRLQMAIPALGRYNTSSKLYAAFATIASLIGLTAAKLVGGNTVLGVAGTALNDATISGAAQLRKGVIAYGKNGTKYTGAMTELAAKTYTPGTANQVISANQFLAGAQTILGDADLISDNIVYKKSIFGVSGSSKVLKCINSSNSSGASKSNKVTFPYASITGTMYYFDVNPGFTPVYAWVTCLNHMVQIRSGPTVQIRGETYSIYLDSVTWNFSSTSVWLPVIEYGSYLEYWIFGY